MTLGNSKYENRLPPEEVNLSSENPLKDFFSLLIYAFFFVAFVVTFLVLMAGWLAPKIPFEYEQVVAEKFKDSLISQFETKSNLSDSKPRSELFEKRQRYLESLNQKIQEVKPLPEDIHVTVHYLEGDTVNAFATIGGHVFIYEGLFNKLNTENALFFVLAHEIGHVAERHPISSFSRSVIVIMALSSLMGLSEASLPDWLMTNTGNLTILKFNRDQEVSADKYALEALQTAYGHVKGAAELFEIFEEEHKLSGHSQPIALLQTHPLNKTRIENIDIHAKDHQSKDNLLTPIPEDYRAGD